MHGSVLSGRRSGLCNVCFSAHRSFGVTLFAAPRVGAAGKQGNTVASYLCVNLACSQYPRGLRSRGRVGAEEPARGCRRALRRTTRCRKRDMPAGPHVPTHPDVSSSADVLRSMGLEALVQMLETSSYDVCVMRERAVLCGGSLRVESARGAGTRVVVRLPPRP